MKLTRVNDGEYHVTHGDRTVKIQRQLNRKWLITPLEGMSFDDKPADSYQGAKKAAEKLLTSGKAQTADVATVTQHTGGDVRAAIALARRALDEAERALGK